MSLPVIKTVADCLDFPKVALRYLPQLYELPEQIAQTIANPQGLKVLYVTTNPWITALAFSIFLAPVVFVVSEINKNYSQVDRLWSILPTVYNLHYCLYAHAAGLPTQRMDALLAASVIWTCRLTFNYWRKGGYSIGSEDYRWEVLKDYLGPVLMFIFNLTFIALAQSLLLFAVTMPSYLLLISSRLLGRELPPTDLRFAVLFVVMVIGTAISDQQQWNYQHAKKEYKQSGKVHPNYRKEDLERGFLTSGLWKHSRHPNFAFEQSVWTTLYAWSCQVTESLYNWTGVGILAYMALFQASTWFTELITNRKYPDYKEYRKRVGKFIPPGLGSALPGDFSDRRAVEYEGKKTE